MLIEQNYTTGWRIWTNQSVYASMIINKAKIKIKENMDSAKNQIADKLKSSNNILITVSRNPSVDQLAACLGLTLVLNKLNKHATAVFSGEVPSTIEFLKPEDTLEKTTDSLRDFIISLDRAKADKLRYKLEDDVVRIFITPYRTSITEKDFDFSQGDFNVDVVVALGVDKQEDVDGAIVAHGRILHDAVVTSINTTKEGGLGTISWHDPHSSSLSELITDLSELLGQNLLDKQVATALLTGIVSETNRFSNQKTTSETMRASAALMAAGADQQLVASKLEEPAPVPAAVKAETPDVLEIEHEPGEMAHNKPIDLPKVDAKAEEEPIVPEISPELPIVSEEEPAPAPLPEEPKSQLTGGSEFLSKPPSVEPEAPLPATTDPEDTPAINALDDSAKEAKPQILKHGGSASSSEPEVPNVAAAPSIEAPAETPSAPPLTPAPADWTPPAPAETVAPLAETPASNPATEAANKETLEEIESAVKEQAEAAEHARDEVKQAISTSAPVVPQPAQDLGAQPLAEALHDNTPAMEQPSIDGDPTAVPQTTTPVGEEHAELEGLNLSADPGSSPQPTIIHPTESPAQVSSLEPVMQPADPNAPPAVPPPIPFQFK